MRKFLLLILLIVVLIVIGAIITHRPPSPSQLANSASGALTSAQATARALLDGHGTSTPATSGTPTVATPSPTPLVDALAAYKRGVTDIARKDYAAAVVQFTAAIQRAPRFSQAYQARGLARASLADYNGAIADYSHAISLNSHFAVAYAGRGLVYYTLGQYSRAVGDFDQALKYNPHETEALYDRAMTYDALHLYGSAVKDYTSYINLAPSDPDGYYRRGIDRYHLQDTAGARQDEMAASALDRRQGNVVGVSRAQAALAAIGS